MKLFVLALCMGSVASFGQDKPQIPVEQRAMIERMSQRLRTEIVSRAVLQHQPFWLQDSSLGPIVITATAVTADEHTLTLAGVEFKSNAVAVSADEAIYDFRSGRIEPRGNVHLAPVR